MTAADTIAVVNAGSSSIKFSLFSGEGEDLSVFLKGEVEGLNTADTHFLAAEVTPSGTTPLAEERWSAAADGHHEAMVRILDFLRDHMGHHRIRAVGHRVVHGGMLYSEPVRLDPEVLAKLETLIPLAPLHQPHNLAPVRTAFGLAPHLVQIACFDTAFHARQEPVAQAFALPATITERGVRRYGFHGLSYEYIASVLPSLDPGLAEAKVVVAHLGNGASLCALKGGRSVASTMGFTAVEGLPMGTRCGALDPGVILYLIDEMGMDARAIERLIYKESGLLGVSGLSSDMRVLEKSADPRARFAIELFAYRIGREIGSLAAALGGLDALVFTAGIGEHSAPLRRLACGHAAWLGLEFDEAANAAEARRISRPGSRVAAWVVPTDEELMIARHCARLLAVAT